MGQWRRRLNQVRAHGPAAHWFSTYHSRPLSRRPLTLLDAPEPAGGPVLVNLANLGRNAGDVLLTVALRDLLSSTLESVRWQARNVHHVVSRQRLAELNRSDGIVIGGGGLFLSDTNRNDLSGWQWSCSVDALERVRAPMAVMAVGYNQFRGQAGFPPVFGEHLRLLVEKSVFVGLRNSGSVRSVAQHLPVELHHRLRLQPCATTLLGLLYPDLVGDGPDRDADFVAVNAAFDRIDLRLGGGGDAALRKVARSLRELSRDVEIRCYAHRPADEAMTDILDAEGVPHRLVPLHRMSPGEVVRAYATPATVIGMRGHAQLIPFGCGRPVVSLVSHDKMRYFLEDVDALDWGVEVTDDDVGERMLEVARSQLDAPAAAEQRVRTARQTLWDTTQANLDLVAAGFGLARR